MEAGVRRLVVECCGVLWNIGPGRSDVRHYRVVKRLDRRGSHSVRAKAGRPAHVDGAGGRDRGALAYSLGVGTNGGILRGFDERGIVVVSGNRFANTEEFHFIPWSAILDHKLAR